MHNGWLQHMLCDALIVIRQGKGTALHHATNSGHPAVVAILLENGADPNAKDNRGERPGDRFDPEVRQRGRFSFFPFLFCFDSIRFIPFRFERCVGILWNLYGTCVYSCQQGRAQAPPWNILYVGLCAGGTAAATDMLV